MVVSTLAELGSSKTGASVHGVILKLNLLHGNSAVGDSFVYMCSKCGAVKDASLVFDEIPERGVVAWTALVIGCVQNCESEKGLQYLCEMHSTGGVEEISNCRTLEGGFQACGNLIVLAEGRCLHELAVKLDVSSAYVIQFAILSMYSKCGSTENTRVPFCEVVNKDLFSWTSIIRIYARLGLIGECFRLFSRMESSGVYPDGMVISCLISGFSNSMKVDEGKAFHAFKLGRNYEIASSSLVSMYCKFGLFDFAEKIFFRGNHNQEKESWNFMVVGYEKTGLRMNCLKLFREMLCGGIGYNLNNLMSILCTLMFIQ